MLENLIVFGGLIVIFYLFAIRPQQRKIREHQTMTGSLEAGDQVVTIGGMFGKIVRLEDERVEIEIADNIRVWLFRDAISRVISEADKESQ